MDAPLLLAGETADQQGRPRFRGRHMLLVMVIEFIVVATVAAGLTYAVTKDTSTPDPLLPASSTLNEVFPNGGLTDVDIFRAHSNKYNGLDNRNGADAAGDVAYGFSVVYPATLLAKTMCDLAKKDKNWTRPCEKYASIITPKPAPPGPVQDVFTHYKVRVNSGFGVYQLCNYDTKLNENICIQLPGQNGTCGKETTVGVNTFADHWRSVSLGAVNETCTNFPPLCPAIKVIMPKIAPLADLFSTALWWSFPKESHCKESQDVTGLPFPELTHDTCTWKILSAAKTVTQACVNKVIAKSINQLAEDCDKSSGCESMTGLDHQICLNECYYEAALTKSSEDALRKAFMDGFDSCPAVEECVKTAPGNECQSWNPQ